jgi:exodeoxyribonuclease VII small subunit
MNVDRPMAKTPLESLTFEQALAELEIVVRELEDGKIGLAESLAHYEHGVALLKNCYGLLRKVELRIVELTGQDADGNPLTKAFEHRASIDLSKSV